MKSYDLFITLFASLTLSLARTTQLTSDRRVLKRSAIKLRSNTGEDGYGSGCSGTTCPNKETIVVFIVVFSIIALICVGYCLAACYTERQEELKAKAKKAKKKKQMADQLKIQTSVYLA